MDLISILIAILVIPINDILAYKRPYSYVCDDTQLYKPYVMAFEGGRGGRELDVHKSKSDPANYFHYLGDLTNVYVCINGPAYLYFSNTTALGLVYDSPAMEVYDHICEMYNVSPGSGATNAKLNRTLQAIQLMGDRENYYLNPGLQLFTAPYYEYDNKQYVNATSLIIFGDDVCFVSKDGETVQLESHVDTRTAPSATDPPLAKRYCKLGYSKLLPALDPTTGVLIPTTDDKINEARVTLRNDHAIRNMGCGAAGWLNSSDAFTASFVKLKADIATMQSKYAPLIDPTDATKLRQEAVVAKINDEIAEIDSEIAGTGSHASAGAPAAGSNKLKQLEKKKKKKEKELKEAQELKKVHEAIKPLLESTTGSLLTILTANTGAPPPTIIEKKIAEFVEKVNELKGKETTLVENQRNELKYREQLDREPYRYAELQPLIEAAITNANAAKGDIVTIKGVLPGLWDPIKEQISNALKDIAALEVLFKQNGKKEYEDIANVLNDKTVKFAVDIAIKLKPKPVHIKMDEVIPSNQNCSELPAVKATCLAGKPDSVDSCDVFKSSLGYDDPKWGADDKWKGDILDSMENIFSSACFRVTKKFTRNIHRVFKYYLTSNKHFNIRHDIPPTPAPALGVVVVPPNTVERDFWKHIRAALQECAKNKTRNMLFFKNTNPSADDDSAWRFIKRYDNGTREDKVIYFHKEQADLEYYFNWVIDWQYKIFATILGLCMPGYETKIPLITSRFYAMYTEDFIIPLRDVWVNSKDNQVFNWILGEFRHSSDVDKWLNRCMESSFIQAERVEYRPLRCLLINGGIEHNYFINGRFAGRTDIYNTI